jgi:tetratricopeptide (TPR) repeat protein
MHKCLLGYLLLILLLLPACQETSGDQPGQIDPEAKAQMKSEADSLLRLSEFHFQNGYATYGLDGLKRVFIKNPYDQEAFERVTNILAQKEDWKTLVDFYNYAIEKYGPNPFLYRNLGICHSRLEQYDYAVNDFRNAVAMESTNPQNYIYLAQTYEKLNRLEEAVSTWNLLLIILNKLPNVENAQEIRSMAEGRKAELEQSMKTPFTPQK